MVRNRTDDELKQLARDIHGGRVFTDRNIRRPEGAPTETQAEIVASLIGHIFMPLGLIDGESRARLLAQEPMLFYEYLSKAGPRSMNGYPMFMSLNIITKEEWPLLEQYLAALEAAPDPLASL